MRAKKLERQLNKAFSESSIEEALPQLIQILDGSGLADDARRIQTVLREFPEFLDMVEESYGQLEEKANLAQRNLEVSSVELTDANKRLFQLNQTFDAMVNSLGQGFFMFGRDGKCLPICSKACERLLGKNPAGLSISDALSIRLDKRPGFIDWYNILFDGRLRFEDFVEIGPTVLSAVNELHVSLEYKPVRDPQGQLMYIVVIATDRTNEIKAQQEARELEAYSKMVVNILRDKPRFLQFIEEARKIFGRTREIITDPALAFEQIQVVKRNLHTLKGAAGIFGISLLRDEIHSLETQMDSQFDLLWIRNLLAQHIPRINSQFEELLEKNRDIFGDASRDLAPIRSVKVTELHEFARELAALGPAAQVLYARFTHELVAMPASEVFQRYEPVLQQAAERLGKKIAPVAYVGGDVALIPENYEDLLATLIHVFRNIADHGIETPSARRSRGKPEIGLVRVSVSVEDQVTPPMVNIVIQDDGNGIDIEKIREKLRKNGRSKLADVGTDEQLLNYVFEPGFSTADTITEFSGRGVGLDAVRHEVENLGGTLILTTEAGKGTTIAIRVPYLQELHSAVIPPPLKAAN